jgi:hypothetical protein
LRDGKVPIPDGRLEQQQLKQEARYYVLPELVAAVKEAESEGRARREQAEEAATASAYIGLARAEHLRGLTRALKEAEAALKVQERRRRRISRKLNRVDRKLVEALNVIIDYAPERREERELVLDQRGELRDRAMFLQEQLEKLTQPLVSAQDRLRKAKLVRLMAVGRVSYSEADSQLAAAEAAHGPEEVEGELQGDVADEAAFQEWRRAREERWFWLGIEDEDQEARHAQHRGEEDQPDVLAEGGGAAEAANDHQDEAPADSEAEREVPADSEGSREYTEGEEAAEEAEQQQRTSRRRGREQREREHDWDDRRERRRQRDDLDDGYPSDGSRSDSHCSDGKQSGGSRRSGCQSYSYHINIFHGHR